MHPVKLKFATSTLLLIFFYFPKSLNGLIDTCDAKSSCALKHDKFQGKTFVEPQFVERETRMVNVRNRVGSEKLVNNRRIVDSDSRISDDLQSRNFDFPRLARDSRDERTTSISQNTNRDSRGRENTRRALDCESRIDRMRESRLSPDFERLPNRRVERDSRLSIDSRVERTNERRVDSRVRLADQSRSIRLTERVVHENSRRSVVARSTELGSAERIDHRNSERRQSRITPTRRLYERTMADDARVRPTEFRARLTERVARFRDAPEQAVRATFQRTKMEIPERSLQLHESDSRVSRSGRLTERVNMRESRERTNDDSRLRSVESRETRLNPRRNSQERDARNNDQRTIVDRVYRVRSVERRQTQNDKVVDHQRRRVLNEEERRRVDPVGINNKGVRSTERRQIQSDKVDGRVIRSYDSNDQRRGVEDQRRIQNERRVDSQQSVDINNVRVRSTERRQIQTEQRRDNMRELRTQGTNPERRGVEDRRYSGVRSTERRQIQSGKVSDQHRDTRVIRTQGMSDQRRDVEDGRRVENEQENRRLLPEPSEDINRRVRSTERRQTQSVYDKRMIRMSDERRGVDVEERRIQNEQQRQSVDINNNNRRLANGPTIHDSTRPFANDDQYICKWSNLFTTTLSILLITQIITTSNTKKYGIPQITSFLHGVKEKIY